MQILIPGVHVSSPAPLSFDRSIELRAFLLRREGGNLLIYSTASLATEVPTVEELGGVARHYLGHEHEAAYGHADAAPFGAPLFCPEDERATVSETCPVEGTFAERHWLDDDFEVIPIPGHTSGSTAFLWDTGQHRCLFSADTVYIRDGEWIAALLPGSSDRRAYLASLELMKELDFDVLLPWTAGRGGPWHAITDRADARRRIDAIIDRLRRGDDH
jgi:glyoxylase-like metal-dependent hydrolase (beta-lactamase superfamily II)